MANPSFALSPALADPGIMDFSTSVGQKLYFQGINKLSEKQFECNASGLKTFLTLLKSRSQVMGWEDILLIPSDISDPYTNLVNLLTNYGQISIEQVKQHASTYMHEHNRAAQDTAMMFHCLMNSLTQEGASKIAIWEAEYTQSNLGNGPSLLKVIIRESDMNTNATERHIRLKLSTLDLHIASIDHDICKFNIYVKELVAELAANGKTTADLLTNIFKAYNTVPDNTFNRYVAAKEDSYDDGVHITADSLMLQCANKYKILVQQGIWNAPTSEQKEIVALKAEIKKFSSYKSKNHSPYEKQRQDKVDPNKFKKKKKPDEAWNKIPPTPEERGKGKEVKGKTYHWCPNHRAWTRHTEKE